jgi:cytochrome c oxidase subunit 3/cytochrome o ubiquinol oxidase subunit 3
VPYSGGALLPPHVQATGAWTPLQAGMATFLVSEVAFFSTLIMTYVYFLSQIKESKPGPAEVFDFPLAIGATVCLLSSSITIHVAEMFMHSGKRAAFLTCWFLTIILGAVFLGCTAVEWTSLIGDHGLTISRNMFGTCYFTVVGFHATHVSVGVLVMCIVFALGVHGRIGPDHPASIQVVSWYWHFVDVVWIVVFTLVYFVGR